MSAQTAPAENSTSGITPAAPWRVKAVSVLPDYRLAVTFQDGLSGVVDCSGILDTTEPGVFAPLSSADFFAQVELNLGVITWPNGADLDPRWTHESIKREQTWSVPF
jgi:Protein of unknown function (DUF2442)